MRETIDRRLQVALVGMLMAVTTGGCAHAPPRVAYVDLDAWAAAQPPPSASASQEQRSEAVRPRVKELARQRGLTLVLMHDYAVWAAPELDLTPALLGDERRAARAGERFAFVDMQRVLEQTRDGQQTKGRLKAEFETKQAELDRRQEEIKTKYPGRGRDQIQRTPEFARLMITYRELKEELQAHEQKAVRAILNRLTSEVAELARGRRLDVVLDVSNRGGPALYGSTAHLSTTVDLTDDLVRLHDERSR